MASFAQEAGIEDADQFLRALPTFPTPQVARDMSAAEAVAAIVPAETVSLASPRDLVVHLVGRALRSEGKIALRIAERKPTGFAAGRRLGMVEAAASALHQMFGVEYEAAKHSVIQGVRLAGEGFTPEDLIDAAKNGAIATTIVDAAMAA